MIYKIKDLDNISIPNNTKAVYRRIHGMLRKYNSNGLESLYFLSNSPYIKGRIAPDLKNNNRPYNFNYSWILKEDGTVCHEYDNEDITINNINIKRLEIL